MYYPGAVYSSSSNMCSSFVVRRVRRRKRCPRRFEILNESCSIYDVVAAAAAVDDDDDADNGGGEIS